MSLWHTFMNRRGETIARELTQVIVRQRTPYQLLEIVDTVSYGRALYLDQKIQSASLDEFIYHEALVQPAMLLAERPRRVFVAGGGEGATLREILRHGSVEHVVMVDIDAEAVAACRAHLGEWHQGAFDDPRVELVHADARQLLAQRDEQFDVVIVDITDPLTEGPSYRLFTVEFYQLVAAHLTPTGVLAVQAESTDVGVWDAHLAVVHTVRQVFPQVAPYRAHVPSFGESWGFLVASRTMAADRLSAAEVDARLQAAGLTHLRFYDGTTHQALFQLPRMLRAAQAAWTRVITDAAPIVLEV
ncbi:MAG: fused MFS/spermidine synthase [Chloroflexi bacterium]|jgi:spermidine synthase|nr:fused MFS/spermidine synthase [Chloroflexota bacterium]